MRRLAALFLIAALAPSTAIAQNHDQGVTVKPRPMHVVQSAPRQVSPLPWAVEAAPPPLLAPAPLRPAGDSRQCGMSCAQTYYFCLSRGEDPDCGSNWSICRASCSPSAAADWRSGR
jgi:hypothetical protein